MDISIRMSNTCVETIFFFGGAVENPRGRQRPPSPKHAWNKQLMRV